MSRRKQAKPRACLKLGDEANVATSGAVEAQVPNANASAHELLDPKEELFSDVDSNPDDVEDNNENDNGNVNDDVNYQSKGQQQQNQAVLQEQEKVNESNTPPSLHPQQLKTQPAVDNCGDPVDKLNQNSVLSEQQETQLNHVKNTAIDDDSNSKSKPSNVTEEQQKAKTESTELHDDIEDDIDGEVEFDDEDDDYEDIQSLDSYYSDMYSTHTSSSYSPSISDGTITPNSLHQHHQHLPPPHHLSSLPHPLAANNKSNGLDGAESTHNDEDNDLHAENGNGNGNGEKVAMQDGESTTMSTRAGSAIGGGGGVEQHLKRQGRHGMRLPSKLRKIDRDALVAGKFDKSTGDGIKSGNNADGSYQCQFCDKSFPRLGYLKKHEQSHAEHLPFKCDYCARLFKHKRSRDRHTKLHTGDRRYRCPHCEAAFSRSDHLKIHMKTHDNQKPFQCTICNRGYNTAAALTSHMQNHKKQAAILAAGGNPQAINYSPRSTGSASSNGSLHKRRYAMALASDSSPSRLDYPKRLRAALLNCSYCTKADFGTPEQLNAHMQTMHEKELATSPVALQQQANAGAETSVFQLACEYCTMKFPNIPAMFQHMRGTHLDRLTSPNSYFEHFNRLAASGTFSPRLVSKSLQRVKVVDECTIKVEPQTLQHSPKSNAETPTKPEEEPTDLSQNKRRSETPNTPNTASPPSAEKPPGIFFCNQCSAGLPDFESFRNHLKTHITQGLHLVCHHCGLSLREQSEYEHHVISHFLITNSEYNCAASCSKTYAKPEELQKHLMEQHVVPMYKCALCADLFESKVAIQVHFACAHSAESKLLRCSACMEVFRVEADFNVHVKTRHQAVVNGGANVGANSLQCMFCRTVCNSELEMHFHLAAHAHQFRCPSCPETFHVEFLLDRHMQNQHGGNERINASKESFEEQPPTPTPTTHTPTALSPMNSLYVNALFGKTPLVPPLSNQNNNNSILDYNVAFAAHLNKGLFPNAGKFYSPLQVDTGAIKHAAHPALMYGLSQRYFDTNRTLIDMYAQHQQAVADKAAAAAVAVGNYFISPKHSSGGLPTPVEAHARTPNDLPTSNALPPPPTAPATLPPSAGYSCDICERNDFRTEAEVHSHRKIVHNMKTGVSLRCAYCAGNFKSRSELEHHMKTCHNSTGKHKCLICDEIFPSPAILAEHKLQHSKVGQSGKCSHCSQPLGDVTAFKAHLNQHNTEGQMPTQCICCRQSLHSEFEISLHAKFHTKSSNVPENVCALCLLEPVPNSGSEAKVCEKCCRKHNLREKYKNRENFTPSSTGPDARPYLENRCNLCKMVLPHANKLQEHLVEHTFAGCEDRGYICYICSAVFTAPSGLLNHMVDHGLNARPYDCNLCTEKYYFRAELDHHLIEHERRATPKLNAVKESHYATHGLRNGEQHQQKKALHTSDSSLPTLAEVKQELIDGDNKSLAGDDDEYIEVENVPELQHMQDPSQRRTSNGELEKKCSQAMDGVAPTHENPA